MEAPILAISSTWRPHPHYSLNWTTFSTLVTCLHKAIISMVIQTFERTYKSLITAGYRLGLHNSISLYIYIFFIAGSSQAFVFVLSGPKMTSLQVSKFTPNVSYKYTNRRQFLRFLDRLHCLKMLWYEHLVQLLCFYPPTASFRALMKFSSCLDLPWSPRCCKQDPRCDGLLNIQRTGEY